MPNWLSTLLIAVVTAVLTTTVASLTVVPRLEARNRRIQAGHQARERFGTAILTVLVTGSLLNSLAIPQEATAAVRDGLEREGARWRQQLSKATEELADSTAPLTFVFVLREVAIRFAFTSRMVWISERSEADKLTALLELAGAAQNLYFTAWWRRPKRVRSLKRLVLVMDALQEDQPLPGQSSSSSGSSGAPGVGTSGTSGISGAASGSPS
ncbi:hypothetical protein [Streptomyces sp. KL116D]|uniref:hypothetical protein n=1 Tax=Streptomyces sp. KL116D TaxID=3045152 RepID=UPI0035564704